jgi:hypothetical protein
MELRCLFENEKYVVCTLTGSGALRTEGVEVVDKEHHIATYSHGKMRRVFLRQVADWREKSPQEEEVEARLDEFLVLNTNPLTLH